MLVADIYLLPQKKRGHLLYGPELGEDDFQPESTDEGASFLRRLFSSARQMYRLATEKSRRTERLLKKTKEIDSLRVHYPSHLAEDEARSVFQKLAQDEIRKHAKWLAIDAVSLPLSAVLSIVPGPNLLLAYLAWRTASHYQSKKGGERAASSLPVDFVPEDALSDLERALRKRFPFGKKRRVREVGRRLELDLERVY